MAVKEGLPATDFSRMNRDYIRNVAEGETVKDGLPATDFSRMNREYIKAVVEEAGGGGGGSSDFSTAEVTLVIDAGQNLVIVECAYIYDNAIFTSGSYGEGTETIDAVLYKGSQVANIYSEDTENLVVSATGSATVGEHGDVTITGTCTITVTVGT